ncbi:unnamed protein product [Urochloa humidicola]
MSASMDSCSFTHQFKINLAENITIMYSVSSEDIFAGGHLWRINCYPLGGLMGTGEHIAIFLSHLSELKGARASFEAFVMDGNGARSSAYRKSFVFNYTEKGGGRDWDSAAGWPQFVERRVLDPLYLTDDGPVIIVCRVKVLPDDEPIQVPPSDITSHLGILLDSAAGSDVSFVVGGEVFPDHRAVLAARSPVFKAQLLGSPWRRPTWRPSPCVTSHLQRSK